MLRKNKRLSHSEFSRFFSSGTRHHSPAAQLIHHTHPTIHSAVVVPKKVLKTAVARNKLRRRVYNIIRDAAREGVFIFILKPKAATLSYNELQDEIITLIAKTNNKTTN